MAIVKVHIQLGGENSLWPKLENTDRQIEPAPEKSKTNDVSIAVANSANAATQNRTNDVTDADEKWWQAQFGFYLKMTKKQQFKMKKMVSDMQLEFECESLENAEQETIPKSVAAKVDVDDPLDNSPPWW